MAVRFVVGRAGSGKTHRCLEAVRQRLRDDPTGPGRLLLLVPEQGSFQMERALVETPQLTGYTRCEVLSFQRLAYRIFAEAGSDPRRGDQTIGGLGRLMVLRRLIHQHRSHLRLLDRVADKPGLIKQLAGTIDELMREKIEPATLAELAEQREDDDPLGAAKLADVTRLYGAYLDYLIDDRLDPLQYLTLAAERLDACAWLDGAEVWVDGFAGFTRQEIDLLLKLAGRVKRMEIALLVAPDASAVEATRLPEMSFTLCGRTERTLVNLRNEFTAAGVAIEEPIRLAGELLRFRRRELARLEAGLFGSPSGDDLLCRPEVVRVLELPDRRAEVDAAVTEIQRLVRQADPPMRYRDIAVIVRDLDAYHDLLAAAMKANHIPCFLDRREPTIHHPLIELVRALLAVARDDCRMESVRLTLKTGLLPLGENDADLLENYLLAHGIAGRDRWEQPWTYTRIFRRKAEDGRLNEWQQSVLEKVNAARKTWLSTVEPWLEASSVMARMTGQEWATALFGCLESMEIGQRLQTWARQCEDDGATDQAQVHRQVWVDFVDLLDEFVQALGPESMSIEQFRETIEASLAEFDLGLAPPTLDEVLVGAIERSRHPAIRAALVLGFDQSHFPARRSEDPILGDREREALESAGVPVGPSRRRQMLDERMLAYIALTRAGERLWISYPRAEADGQPVQPSPFLPQILAAVPGLQVESIPDPRQSGQPLWLTRVADLGGRLAGELRYRPVLNEETDLQRRAVWNALFEVGRHQPFWESDLRRCLAGLAYRNEARLDPALPVRLYPSTFLASVSRLEEFAACPFAHFADYVLRLEPRAEVDLADVDVGTFCHAILEKFIDDLARSDTRLGELEDDEITARVDAVAADILPQLADDLMLGQARNGYLYDRSRSYMGRVARWQRDAARVGRFQPRAVEFPFGYSGQKAAPLTLTTPRGRKILLRGKIDRVDVADLGDELLGMVVDYKTTTNRTLDLTKVFHGLSLQLIGYLLALQQSGHSLTGRPIKPVAALYLPLLEPFQSVDHPAQNKKSGYRWRGIVDVAGLDVLDGTARDAGKSEFLSAQITKEGKPYKNSDLAESEQLVGLMQHVGRRMGELADGLLDGDIAASPYRLRKHMPCVFCDYRAICRYEIELQQPRKLDSFDKGAVLKGMAGEDGDE